ncbi:MAG: nucleotidyl transferase AbiEii/AbiGii toxin family protein [Candidatus Gracilibacteria bacterium]|jgi:predicted nucleotidyltransferase component of viral defense system
MPLYQEKHREIMLKILKDIVEDTSLGPLLGFKGGTAAYLFYGLERFSVDLDFDLLDPTKEDFVFEKVKKIMENYGELKDVYKKRFNLFYLLSYEGKDPSSQNVKVEINRRDFHSKYGLKSYMGISALVMEKEDMTANKLIAMYARLGRSNRDIFDVWFFLNKFWPINDKMIEERMKMPFKKFLKLCISALEKMDDKMILDGLGELLSEKQKSWAREKLKADTIFQLKILLGAEEDERIAK